jgi:hypothetical protein
MTVCLDTNVFLQIFGHRQPPDDFIRRHLVTPSSGAAN